MLFLSTFKILTEKKKLEKGIGPQIFFKSFENAKRDLDI